ncbi:alanine racemase [Proteinivorax hydrogeniformans]|uniref:Alanine racemase n=1 Tax=Proteinivorax hydrogeniformans TaxID=1826727 RepID=A0AAU8HTJ0_9FIRM
MYRPTYAEISLQNIRHNVKELTKDLGPDTRVMAVVKADGYGHGSVEVAQAAIKAKATDLAVATVEEAIELRKNNIKEPILILGFVPISSVEALIKYKLTATIYDFKIAKELNKRAKTPLPVHVKIDTGMHRLGVPWHKAKDFLLRLKELENIRVEGIFTHFSNADDTTSEYPQTQRQRFLQLVENLPYKIPIKHISNSAGVIEKLSCMPCNMIRLGIVLYGLYPSEHQKGKVNLKPAMTIKTEVASIKEVEQGAPISYGLTYKTSKATKIATLPIGYADGYYRSLSNKAWVEIKGHKAPVLGTVCMDYIMVDVSEIDDVCVGEEVTVIGGLSENCISVDTIAKMVNTINYEVVCSISKRVPRIYKN